VTKLPSQGNRNCWTVNLDRIYPAGVICPRGNLTFDRASGHSWNDLPLEEDEHDERRNRDDDHICEEDGPLCFSEE